MLNLRTRFQFLQEGARQRETPVVIEHPMRIDPTNMLVPLDAPIITVNETDLRQQEVGPGKGKHESQQIQDRCQRITSEQID